MGEIGIAFIVGCVAGYLGRKIKERKDRNNAERKKELNL